MCKGPAPPYGILDRNVQGRAWPCTKSNRMCNVVELNPAPNPTSCIWLSSTIHHTQESNLLFPCLSSYKEITNYYLPRDHICHANSIRVNVTILLGHTFRQGLHIHVCPQHFNTRSRLDQGVFPPKKNLLKQNDYTPSKWWKSPLYDVQHFHVGLVKPSTK